MDRLVDPILTDLQVEYVDAIRRSGPWAGRRVRLVGYITFLQAIAMHACSRSLRVWNDSTGDERLAITRTIAFSVPAIFILTILLEYVLLAHTPLWSHATYTTLSLYLLPATLPLSLPIGFALAIVFALRERATSRRIATGVMAAALTCSTLSFATSNWLTPETNQAYRIEASGRSDVLKGANELTFGELTRAIDVIKRGGVADRRLLLSNQPLREMALVLHGRIALSAAAILLAVLAIAIAPLAAAARVGFAAIVCSVYLWFFGYLESPSETFSVLPALAVAWIPNILAALLVAILRIASSIPLRTA
jgi:lipopolysaccharide export LptBFGC system permease protein LptF